MEAFWSKKPLLAAIKASGAVALGYVLIGCTFGMLFQTLGYAWYWAGFVGLFVYSGALQFLSVGMLAAHAQYLELFIASLTLGLRHIFYSLSLMPRYQTKFLQKSYLIFSLTDETFSVISAEKNPSINLMTAISALNHASWVLGCCLGAYFESHVTFSLVGFDFILTALFVVLAVEQLRASRDYVLFGVGVVVAILSIQLFPKNIIECSLLMAAVFVIVRSYWCKNSLT